MGWIELFSRVQTVIIIFLLVMSFVVIDSRSPIILTYNISEEVESGTLVGNILDDGGFRNQYDGEIIQQLRFRFLSQPTVNFDLEMTTGSIFTTGRFDREEFCPLIKNCVIKLDIAVQPVQFFQIVKVSIIVKDLNDNWPKFTEAKVSHQLPESVSPGTSISLPSAVDLDSPKYGITSYELVDDSQKFLLEVEEKVDDSIDVKLILRYNLDREVKNEYHIQLVAYDGGDLSGVADIYVHVLDVNDNGPHFTNHTYDISIVENIPLDSTILRVKAFDPDEGKNGQVKYTFTQRTREKFGTLFAINQVNGDIVVKGEIDYEVHKVLHLGIIAEDQGVGTLPAETTVIVHIVDTNDNAPEIKVNTLTGSQSALVSEDSPIGTFVAHVTVEDKDNGVNGKFDCHLVHNTLNLVKLYMNEYQVTTKSNLDRESKSYYDILIQCVDHGNPYQETTKALRVIIGDFNDNAPHFNSKTYLASIIENNAIGAAIIKMNATDMDIGLNADIEYSLKHDDHGYFNIDKNTGLVKARTVFDRETDKEIHFHVVVTDKGTPRLSSSAMVLLSIIDVNDEAPEFMQTAYSFGVFENEHTNTEVGQVGAIDRDDSPGNEFYYSFAPPRQFFESDPSDKFSIDSKSGVIKTMLPLDREVQSTYHFIVLATDKGVPPRSSSASVTVYVADQNDNVPIFEFPTPYNNTIRIPVNAHRGYVVTRILARDADLGQNAKITYQVSNATKSENLFSVDVNYGIITTNRALKVSDYDFHRLYVTISDNGNVPNKATTILNILVDETAVIASGSSLGSGNNDGDDDFFASNNFIIIISLAVISGVVTLVLILTIILIHRHNQAKKEQNFGRYNCRKEALRMFPNISRASDERTLTFNQSNSINASTMSDNTLVHKKEVSFNIEVENNTSKDSNDTDIVRGARPDSRQSIPSTIDPQVLQHPQAHSSALSMMTSNSSLPGNQNPVHQVTGSSLNTANTLEVIHEQQEEQRQLEMDRLMDMLRRGGDNGSMGSNDDGGSITDSGRGPSEEGDIHTLSSHSQSVEIPTFTQDFCKRTKSPDNNQVVPSISANTTPVSQYDDCKTAMTTFLPLPPSQHNTTYSCDKYIIPRNERTESDSTDISVGSDCTLINQSKDESVEITKNAAFIESTGTFRDSIVSDSKLSKSDTDYFYGSYLDYLKKKTSHQNSLNLSNSKNYSSVLGTLNETEDIENGIEYSCADMSECGKNNVADHSLDEDDNASSTSGSYVVDPQELCKEIDQLFFKDTPIKT